MRNRILALMLTISLLPTTNVWAVNHVRPGAYPHATKDQIHHPSAAQVRRFGSLRAATVASTVGTKKVAVIVVQFPSASPGLTSGNASIVNFSNIDHYFNAMKSYYAEVSYNTLGIQFTYFGPNATASTAAAAGAYTLGHAMEYYGCGDEACGCQSSVPTPTPGQVNANGDYLIRDAIERAHTGDPSLISASLNPTTGYDAVIVMHAGNGNETSGGDDCSNSSELGDIWSIFYSADSVIQSASSGTVGFDEGDVVPETEALGYVPTGVMCHEFGHTLGLPDLYNTLTGASVVGSWELMDAGPYDDLGSNPAHMGAWDKAFLGWSTPTPITSKTVATLPYIEATPTMIKIPVQNGLPNEYFLAEYRSRTSGKLYDQDIPGDGLLVWHIDDNMARSRGVDVSDPNLSNTVNSGIGGHYGVSIVTANGVVLSNADRGDPGNTFNGNPPGFTSPQSDSFAGQPSGINVVNISGIGTATASLDVLNLTVSTSQSISKVSSFPNPAGKGYPHPKGDMHATIQFQATKPANDYQINIYTLSGDLVRKISNSDIALNGDRSANMKWVYEYVWDLKNGDGAMVAPGVYLFLVRVDGQTKSGKAVIIR